MQRLFQRYAIVALLALIGGVARPQAVAAQAAAWGPTEIRSQAPGGTSAFPAIAYDAGGRTHIAWMEYGATDADPSRVLYTNNVAGTWLAPFEVSSSGGRGAEPLVAIAAEGERVHFLYFTQGKSIAHRYVTLSGAAPAKGPVTTLTTNKGANPQLLIDGAGRVHGFWITRVSDSAPYQVYHRIWANGWGAGARVVRPTANEQKFPKAAMTADGHIHVVFLHKDSNQFLHSVFDPASGAWAASTPIAASNPKQIAIAAAGATLYVLYSAQPGAIHNIYFIQGGGGGWTSPVLMSSGGSFDDMPELLFSPANQRAYAFWISGSESSDARAVVREYGAGGFTPLLSLGGEYVQYPQAAASSSEIGVVWEDKVSGSYDVRHRRAPIEGAAAAVDFTLAAAAGSGGLQVSLGGLAGSPDAMRAGAAPFAADAPASGAGSIPWQPLASAFDFPAAPDAACQAAVYVQLRNSATGMVSPVRRGGAMLDTAIQAAAIIRANPAAGQPAAPAPPDPNYSRGDRFLYDITQEPSGCAGIARHSAGGVAAGPAAYPIANQEGRYAGLAGGADNGGGLIEQTVRATVRLTDTAGNSQEFVRAINLDDDPPVLAAGGQITFTRGLTSASSLVEIAVTAAVTDDGYLDPAVPADQRYWGLWVVATESAALPPPAVFAQYGRVTRATPGANAVTVQVTNAGLSGPGARYVHVRFLDGAGNYSQAGLTSPQLTLEPGFSGWITFHPLTVVR